MRKITHRRSRTIMWALISVGFIIAGLPLIFPPAESALLYFICLGAAAAFCGVFVSARYMRCPHCRCMLNLYGGSPNVCPYCGKKI